MASGIFWSGYYGGSALERYNVRLGIQWSSTPNQATNSSSVTISVIMESSSVSTWGLVKNGTTTINGSTQNFSKSVPDRNDDSQIWQNVLVTRTATVPHNSDGSRSVDLAATFAIEITYTGVWIGTMSVGKTVTLDQIQTIPNKPSNVSVSGLFNKGEEMRVTFTGASGATGYKVYARYYNHSTGTWNANWSYQSTVVSNRYDFPVNSAAGAYDGIQFAVSSLNGSYESDLQAEEGWDATYRSGCHVWNGSSWVTSNVPQPYNSGWKNGIMKYYNGTSWVATC